MIDASVRFEQYLTAFRARLQQLQLARGGAMLALAALIITVAAVAVAIRNGFPPELVIAARVLLLASLGAIVIWMIVVPMRRLARGGIREMESRAPAFHGRVETFLGSGGRDNPLRELLADDSLKVAAHFPPERQIRSGELAWPWSVAALAFGALLWLAMAGPGNYAYGVRHLWAGWAISDLLPEQSIAVEPGDQALRRGANLRVVAAPRGFEPSGLTIHANFGSGDWQQVAMSAGERGFEFTFFSIREPMAYYVAAGGVRSQTYQVEVVELPEIERISLTYHFPEWTKRSSETHERGGDVRAVAGTEVEVDIRASATMPSSAIVKDDNPIRLTLDGNTARGRFRVEKDGQYYIGATVGGERLRLSDDYFITVLEDQAPEVFFVQPGRDWSASNIEEVTTRVTGRDDYAIESLELRYSVNGGEWQTVPLAGDQRETLADHVFFLESLAAQGEELATLVPGDLVSYYAVATDREHTVRTDMFFIDVQPFDRRYSQSQQSGGAGQQGGDQTEISDRQREIIVSTWNLMREQAGPRSAGDTYVADNAALLAELQTTLRAQAQTLAQRSRARQLTASDDDIARFIENLDKAAEAMVPAAERLGAVDFENAIRPEQEALQYLLRAEAVFRDITLSFRRADARGGGGQAGRDLTEMFELEMDLEKNQYETGSVASAEPRQQQLDDAAAKLAELARRQEQLARDLSGERPATPAERWQQEMLRRETEELRERLDQMQRQSSARAGQSGPQQSGSSGAADAGSNPAEPSGETDMRGERALAENELQRRIDSALRAMNEAETAMREGDEPESLQRAALEARRQLEGARDRAGEELRAGIQESFTEFAERSATLYDRQVDLEQELLETVRNAFAVGDGTTRINGGLSYEQEEKLAALKREMHAELQALEQQMRKTARQLQSDEPLATEQLQRAVAAVRDDKTKERLAVAAEYIAGGEAIYVISSESGVSESLREFRDNAQRARAMTVGANAPGVETGPERTFADIQGLRRELEELTEAQAQRAGPGFGERHDPLPGNADTRFDRDYRGVPIGDPAFRRDLGTDLRSAARDIRAFVRALDAASMSAAEIADVYALARELETADFSGNPDILGGEAKRALELVEQLELALAKAGRESRTGVRATRADEVPEGYREIVAEYYRRLGRSEFSP